ncbi:MAG TPA: tRNA-dihydrouridine synthase [Candidatus Dojkabacteria bacterium]|nr:tRNA-dihydrouridine synthase [Candidatus Dojkabacteria bacterium]
MNIYRTFERPILSLAPMEEVTDTVFRQVVASIQRPDLFYTEFVNVEGVNSQGRDKVQQRLQYDKSEKPIIAQLWGIEPNNYYYVSKFVKDLGFDGVDINMGCSVKKVVSKYNGSGMMIADRGYVKDVIDSVKEGAEGLPISIKTRLGWDSYDLDWIKFLLEQNLDALTIHGRTATGFRSKKVLWSRITPCVDLRNELGKKTLIFGNGEIQSLKQAKLYAEKFKVDGVMIGRAAITNPWIFSGNEGIPLKESFEMFKKHILLFKDTWGETKDFNVLKKFVKSYIYGFVGSQEIREDLMNTGSIKELLSKVEALT